MSTAGYSGTPLAKKLGIKDGHVVSLLDAPAELVDWLAPLPAGVVLHHGLTPEPDVVLAFFTERARLEGCRDELGEAIHPDGSWWVCWPKKAAKVPTDITEDTVREVALPVGLVDNKVCAVSEVWSALRLVWRRENR